ncbi:MAG: hypothetical protein ABI720_08745 [Actinomycetes bacterium]
MVNRRRGAVSIGVLVAAVALTASLVPGATAAGKSWHIISPDVVGKARLSKTAIKNIDPTISSVVRRRGGEGNVEVCGFQRTERISASRQSRWDAGVRRGTTTIMQFQNLVDGGAAFSRIKQSYLNCTPDSFGYKHPDRVNLKASYVRKKKQMRLVWTIYTSAAKVTVLRAEGLAVRRAGGALIVTRSITKVKGEVKPGINTKLTARQYTKYRAKAFY